MGNVIRMPREQGELVESLSMSNGLTSVFMDVLVLSGSALADSAREKELIIWLAQQDQSIRKSIHGVYLSCHGCILCNYEKGNS